MSGEGTTIAERVTATAGRGRSRAALAAYWGLRAIGVPLVRLYFRFEVVHRDRIPPSGSYVICPVHRSNLDFMLPALAIRRRVRWMAKGSIFLGGWIDRFLYAMGSFPVNRTGVDRESLLTCGRVVADGEPIVMFPEGRRKEGPVVEDLFAGPAYVACNERVPILPIGIGGSARAMPIGQKMVWPRKIVLVIGEPIYPDVPLEGRVPRATVDATTERIRVAVQALYEDAQPTGTGGRSP
jgi:1-acyl-sn-glycerol-3-phosphate acyltransferase